MTFPSKSKLNLKSLIVDASHMLARNEHDILRSHEEEIDLFMIRSLRYDKTLNSSLATTIFCIINLIKTINLLTEVRGVDVGKTHKACDCLL